MKATPCLAILHAVYLYKNAFVNFFSGLNLVCHCKPGLNEISRIKTST